MRMGRLITVGTMALGAYRTYRHYKDDNSHGRSGKGRGRARRGGLLGRH